MNNLMKILLAAGIIIVVAVLVLSATGLLSVFPVRSNTTGANSQSETGMANPASVHCEDQGYTVEMRTDEQGGQYGMCIFPDGSECDEWAYFRGECSPGSGE